MQLTVGQKEALKRKAQAIIEEKRQALTQKMIAEYKPSKEISKQLAKIEKVLKLRDEYVKAAVAAGLVVDWSNLRGEADKIGFKFSIQHSSEDSVEELMKIAREQARNTELRDKANGLDIKFPSWEELADELELSCLDKSFDVEKYLSKYRNL